MPNPYGDINRETYRQSQDPDIQSMMLDYLWGDDYKGAHYEHAQGTCYDTVSGVEVSCDAPGSYSPSTEDPAYGTAGYGISKTTKHQMDDILSLLTPWHQSVDRMQEDANITMGRRDLETAGIEYESMQRKALVEKMKLERIMSGQGGLTTGATEEQFTELDRGVSRESNIIQSNVAKMKQGISYDTVMGRQKHRDALWDVYSDWVSQKPGKAGDLEPHEVAQYQADPYCIGDDCDSWAASGSDSTTSASNSSASVAQVQNKIDPTIKFIDETFIEPIQDFAQDVVDTTYDDVMECIENPYECVFSDDRLKRDVIKIDNYRGVPLYRYNYIWDDNNTPARKGFMASDIEKILPEAVGEEVGYKTVNYRMVIDYANAGGQDGIS